MIAATRCRVLVTSMWFEPGYRGGGPIRSVARIIDTAGETTDVVLLTSDRDVGDVAPYAELTGATVARGRSTIHYLDIRRVSAWWRVARDLRPQRFDLLYVNSLLNPLFTTLPLLAARIGLITADRILIAPRGELSPGAMSLKARKKRMFLRLAGPLLRNSRVEWHASTTQEATQILTAFPAAKVMIVAVDQTSLPPQATREAAAHDGAIAMVFLSRISAKKNLDLVIRALGAVIRPALLDVYGPVGDSAYWNRCLAAIDRLPSHVSVTYRGEVLPAEVRSTFARYDAFVFPTLGENFGHVIAESLSASCAVICSTETPWTVTLERGGGRVLRDLEVETLTQELDRLAALSPDERHDMREAAGSAYDDWRRETVDVNVIDEWRLRRLEAEDVRAMS